MSPCRAGKAADSAHTTTLLSVTGHYEEDLNALVNESLKTLDSVLFYISKYEIIYFK